MYKTKKLAILLSMMSAFYLAGCSDDNSGSSDNNSGSHENKCADQNCPAGCNSETGECIEDNNSGSHENKCADQNCPAGCNSETGECIEDGTSEITINGDTSSWVKIAKLPANAEGSDPWPDGIIAFDIGGTHYFGIAGEASDSIIIVDDKGNEVSNTRITESMVPSDYPCLKDDDFAGVAYSPDSITAFVMNQKTYLAVTLRYAGAVIIFDVTNPASPAFELIVHAGVGDITGTGTCTDYSNMTKVYPEGISSGMVGKDVYIFVANEGDSTVTSLKVEDISTSIKGLVAGQNIKITQSITKDYGGNIESVRFVEDRSEPSFIAVSSKSRTIHYLEVAEASLNNYYDDYIGSYTQSEYEFTNSAVLDEKHTLITLTKPTKSGDKFTACAGELLIIENDKTASGGNQKVTSVTVGPMPDSVAISPNKKYAITADEQDSTDAWGKCPVNDGKPGVSIIQLADDSGNLLETPRLLKQIQFGKNDKSQPREPEYVSIASDNDTVAVTLQDSHEVAIFKISDALK